MRLQGRIQLALRLGSVREPPQHDWRAQWFTGLCYVLLAIACALAIVQPYQGDVSPLDRILRVDSALLLQDGAAPAPVSLPDRWLRNRGTLGDDRSRRYRVSFWRWEIVGQDLTLYLPSVSKNYRVTLNGVALPAYGEIGDDPSWHHNRPVIQTLPFSLLRDGENTLELQVFAHSVYDGALDVFYLGDAKYLCDFWQLDWALSTGAAYVVLVMALLFAVVAGVLSAGNNPEYRLALMIFVSAALLSERWLVTDPWLSAPRHLAFAELVISVFWFALSAFLYRIIGASPTQILLQRLWMMGICFVELALLLFADSIESVYELTRWTKLLTTLSILLLFAQLLRGYIRQLNLIRLIVLCSLFTALVGSVHENLMRFALIDITFEYRFQWGVLYLLLALFGYFTLDAMSLFQELRRYRGRAEADPATLDGELHALRQTLMEKQRWSALGWSAVPLWRQLREPLQHIFESSVRTHEVAEGDADAQQLTITSHRAMASAQRCLRTIDELELLLREPTVETIELDMQRWAPELLRELHKRYRVKLRLGTIQACAVVGDPYLLRDCIERLIENADRACELRRIQGMVEVGVRCEADTVIMSVRDNGPGISPSLVRRIREPLSQGATDGLGAGLCIVKRNTELMGVELRCSSSGAGTSLEFVFARVV